MEGTLTQPPEDRSTGENCKRPFEPGEQVEGRFRIVREIGRGGMGVVYEAIDNKLERRVAIKCTQPGFRHWLSPEVRAAREVSHFNVCKVHDIHTARTARGDVEFLSMEFIQGETLSDRLAREGHLAAEPAREIAVQVCAGLEQAHRQGVIHGDLKPGNVILARSPHGGIRAVITDFGLSTLNSPANDNVSPGGTLDYMAPELFLRKGSSVASDIYALGVVLHEMLTGRTGSSVEAPQAEAQASTLTMSRPRAALGAARRVERLPAPWRAIVTRCLDPAPERRFASAGEIGRRLLGRRSPSKWIPAMALAVAAAVAPVIWTSRANPGPAVRLAVLAPTLEGEPVQTAAGLGMELADRLSRLRHGLVVIPPGEAQRNGVNTPEKAKTTLGATHVLRTRLKASGGQIAAVASIVETASGFNVRELRGTYRADEIPVLAKALTATVTGAFHLPSGAPAETVSAAAYSYYVQGIHLLRRDSVSADEAIPFFQKAVELDPRSALPYAGLADAQMQKFERGHGRLWLDQAEQNVARAQSLNADSVPVILASGSLKQRRGWYERAAQDFRRAVELSPDDSEAWDRLAAAYAGMNWPDEAIATYRKAIQAQPGYYKHYFNFGLFYYFRGQLREAEELLRRVTDIAPELAVGQMDLGLVLKEEGRLREAEQTLLRSLRLQENARILTNLGALYYQQERYAEAAGFFERSLAAEPPTTTRYANAGDAYRHLGRTREAMEAYRRARMMAEAEVSQNPRDPWPRARLAFISAQLGDVRRAAFEIAQALNLGPENAPVMREAALTYEVMHQREKTLEVLARAPSRLLEELKEPAGREGFAE